MFSSQQIAVERVIMKVFTKCAIPLEISDSIQSTFRTKLWRLGKTLSILGGTKRKQQLKAWEETIWSFSVDPKEVSRQLMERKRKAEKQLDCEILKKKNDRVNCCFSQV